MSKIYSYIIFTILGANTINAQSKGDIEFGINVGFNSAFVEVEYGSSKHINRYNLGGSVAYYFNESWSVKSKLIYDKKGWGSGDGFNKVSLDYFTIPVNAVIHFGNRYNWYVHFGPYFSTLLKAQDQTYGVDIKEVVSSNDFGMNVGLGVKVPVSKKLKVFFEIDLARGFKNINYDEDRHYFNISNNRSSANVGINFLLK